jgi:hypothetical protein
VNFFLGGRIKKSVSVGPIGLRSGWISPAGITEVLMGTSAYPNAHRYVSSQVGYSSAYIDLSAGRAHRVEAPGRWFPARRQIVFSSFELRYHAGLSSMAEVLPRKQGTGVRFPQPAPELICATGAVAAITVKRPHSLTARISGSQSEDPRAALGGATNKRRAEVGFA